MPRHGASAFASHWRFKGATCAVSGAPHYRDSACPCSPQPSISSVLAKHSEVRKRRPSRLHATLSQHRRRLVRGPHGRCGHARTRALRRARCSGAAHVAARAQGAARLGCCAVGAHQGALSSTLGRGKVETDAVRASRGNECFRVKNVSYIGTCRSRRKRLWTRHRGDGGWQAHTRRAAPRSRGFT